MFGAAVRMLQPPAVACGGDADGGDSEDLHRAGASLTDAMPAGGARAVASTTALQPGALVMSYVQRRPETTLLKLHAAAESGLVWSCVPWGEYADTQPLLDATIIIFRRHAEGSGATPAAAGSASAITAAAAATAGSEGAEASDGNNDDGILNTALGLAEGTHPDGAKPAAAGFARLLAATFPDVVPAIRRAQELRRELEEEAAAWRPPSP
jgi:hypothetical protein